MFSKFDFIAITFNPSTSGSGDSGNSVPLR
jgi:hypothetical protein